MVKRAAPRVESLVDADSGTAREDLIRWRERALYPQRRDLHRSVVFLTSVVDLATLGDCCCAGKGRGLLTCPDGSSPAAIRPSRKNRVEVDADVAQRAAAPARRPAAGDERSTSRVVKQASPLIGAPYQLGGSGLRGGLGGEQEGAALWRRSPPIVDSSDSSRRRRWLWLRGGARRDSPGGGGRAL